MSSLNQKEHRIPGVRADLQIFPGPSDMDGSPTYNIYDPERNAYYKVSWAEMTLIKRIRSGMTAKELQEKVQGETTLRVSVEEIQHFIMDLQRKGLLNLRREGEHVLKESKLLHVHPIKKVLLQYLFFRIPLVNPDAFLARTLHWVRPFLSAAALSVYLFVILWGLFIVAVHWEDYLSTFTYFFNVAGLFSYVLAIIFTKLVHEFAHAYTAKKYDLHIPTMGVAFLVLFPVLYTDATDAWRLSSRRKRIAITAAGVFAELAIAGISTVFWVNLDPGILKSVCFILGSVNWISTLLVNMNPALRFDGYYIFSDWLGVENLQPRAFQLFRQACYRTFLGLRLPDPEPRMPGSTRRVLVVYAACTIVYRIFLYTAIALLVYYKFTKVVGIFLFFVEVLVFFVWPIAYETQLLRPMVPSIRFNIRVACTTLLTSVVLIWWMVPWPHQLSFPGLTLAMNSQRVYAPFSGKIEKVLTDRGQSVQKEDLLLVIQSKELETRERELQLQQQLVESKLAVIAEEESMLPFYLEKQAELARVAAELKGVREQRAKARVRAMTDGKIYLWDDQLHSEQFVQKDQELGLVASIKKKEVVAYVPESDINMLEVGMAATFRDTVSCNDYAGTITRIAPIRSHYLEHSALASNYGGDLPVTQKEEGLLMQSSYFPVFAELSGANEDLQVGNEGKLFVRGPWRSQFVQLVKWILSIFWQEGNL